MFARSYHPLTFCFIGFGWLALASILGLAMLVGLVGGTPLPPWVRALHVHAVLVGGVTQIMLGGFLLLVSPLHSVDRRESASHPLTLWAMNGGVIGMLVGFWLHQDMVVGGAGFVVIAAFLSVIHTIWGRVRETWTASFGYSWYFTLSLLALIGGSAFGEIAAFGLMPESYGYVRLAHIHLVVLGFVVLAIVGMMHRILSTVWNTPLVRPRLAQPVMITMSIGVTVLIGGFLNSSVFVEMAGGGILFIGGALLIGDLFNAWRSSTHAGGAASDHLLISGFFLLFTIILGVLVGANNLSSPQTLPYGKLHLVAYTHMTFVGFVVNAIMGAFSYLVPGTLAAHRVSNSKKRGPYLEHLTAIMDRWRTVQIAALSLGTMGLGILAALAWNVPLSSIYIRVAIWSCLGLILTSFVIFSAKLTAVVAKQPEALVTPHVSPEELKLTA
ncbi:MAG: hypothetical protein NDI90_10610 [Nitrospira sp. BO4]|jgi:hypothetical protein|nr:hypothetical protein [Nitrospira sp. BO4]